MSGVASASYLQTKHWLLSNFFGICFTVQVWDICENELVLWNHFENFGFRQICSLFCWSFIGYRTDVSRKIYYWRLSTDWAFFLRYFLGVWNRCDGFRCYKVRCTNKTFVSSRLCDWGHLGAVFNVGPGWYCYSRYFNLNFTEWNVVITVLPVLSCRSKSYCRRYCVISISFSIFVLDEIIFFVMQDDYKWLNAYLW